VVCPHGCVDAADGDTPDCGSNLGYSDECWEAYLDPDQA
jgi:hypothetical protein